MPLSREAQQVSNDISEAGEVYRERKISGCLDPVAITIEIARLIGEERRGGRAGSPRINIGTDPVSTARKNPRIPFAPTSEVEASTKPRRSHKKKAVKTPVAPRTEALKKPRRSRRRS